MTPRLRVERLTIHGVGPIDLELGAGACLGIFGPSGAGKTLFLRAIADMESHGGAVYLDGSEQERFRAPDWRRQVALLPAESMWWSDTVGEHFARSIADGLSRLGMQTEIMTWPVSRLSSGERQRLALLRLMENRPRLLLLDEPTANLDSENAARVETLVHDYCEATDAAVLWVGHRMTQLRRVATQLVGLSNGKINDTGGTR